MRVIHLLRKPFEGTVAATALTHGTAGINILGTRIECEGGSPSADRRESLRKRDPKKHRNQGVGVTGWGTTLKRDYVTPQRGEDVGRFPANMILSPEAAEVLDAEAPHTVSRPSIRRFNPGTDSASGFLPGMGDRKAPWVSTREDEGGPSRFFKVVKS